MNILEQTQCLFNGQVEYLRNVMLAVSHGERLAGEAPPMAGWAAHFDVGQEVHFARSMCRCLRNARSARPGR